MILKPNKDNGKEMLRFTLIDLLMKKVLETEVREERQGKIIKKNVKKVYVKKGDAFAKATLRPHEEVFCRFLSTQESMELKDLAKKVYEEVKNFKDYQKKYVCESLVQKEYFQEEKKRVLLVPVTKYNLTQRGVEAKEKIQSLLEQGDRHFKEWMGSDLPRALSFLTVCGANILLLKPCDLETLKAWMKELSGLKAADAASDIYPYTWYDYASLGTMDALTDIGFADFDVDRLSGFDSFDDFDAGFGDMGGGYDD